MMTGIMKFVGDTKRREVHTWKGRTRLPVCRGMQMSHGKMKERNSANARVIRKGTL
jgi:hypothetical protein